MHLPLGHPVATKRRVIAQDHTAVEYASADTPPGVSDRQPDTSGVSHAATVTAATATATAAATTATTATASRLERSYG